MTILSQRILSQMHQDNRRDQNLTLIILTFCPLKIAFLNKIRRNYLITKKFDNKKRAIPLLNLKSHNKTNRRERKR